jgi:hypothetical protein
MAHGGQAALIELYKQFAWLRAALQTSPVPFRIYLSTLIITASKDTCSSSLVPSITVHLGFTITPTLDHGLSSNIDGTYWHTMFHNLVVINRFPILT